MKIEDCEQVDDDTENNFIQPEEEREPWTPLSPDPNADDENLQSGANAQFKDGKRGEDEVAEEQKAERQESSETKETSEHSEGNNDNSFVKTKMYWMNKEKTASLKAYCNLLPVHQIP